MRERIKPTGSSDKRKYLRETYLKIIQFVYNRIYDFQKYLISCMERTYSSLAASFLGHFIFQEKRSKIYPLRWFQNANCTLQTSLRPSPMNPTLHVHWKDPAVFAQTAFALHWMYRVVSFNPRECISYFSNGVDTP